MALPLGRYWAANFGSVMSGLVDDGVMMARLPSDRIGAIALPAPDICGPRAATKPLSETILRALVAAWAGSYWPAVAVPSSNFTRSNLIPGTSPYLLASSKARMAPLPTRMADSESAPVSDRSMPILMVMSAAWAPWVTANVPAAARAAAVLKAERREIMYYSPCLAVLRTRLVPERASDTEP